MELCPVCGNHLIHRTWRDDGMDEPVELRGTCVYGCYARCYSYGISEREVAGQFFAWTSNTPKATVAIIKLKVAAAIVAARMNYDPLLC